MDRYSEYPKLKTLVERKDGLIASRATPPAFLQVFHVFYPELLHVTLKASAAIRRQHSVLTYIGVHRPKCQITVFRQGC